MLEEGASLKLLSPTLGAAFQHFRLEIDRYILRDKIGMELIDAIDRQKHDTTGHGVTFADVRRKCIELLAACAHETG